MNGHDFTLEQNTEARMMLAVARRGLAGAINDAENGIGHLSCDDPKIMEQVRAHWRRLYDTYMNADALLSDLESCARHLTDGDKWEPNPIADGMKPMEMAKGCACFIAETPDGGLIIPSEPTPGENTAKRLANTLNALTGDVLLDATGIRLLGTQFLFAYHSRLDRPVDETRIPPASAVGSVNEHDRQLLAKTETEAGKRISSELKLEHASDAHARTEPSRAYIQGCKAARSLLEDAIRDMTQEQGTL